MTSRSKHDMPVKGSKHAPKKFKGQPHYAKEFLDQYQELFEWDQVTSDKDKCKYIRRYCNREVREILDTLIEEKTTWDDLKKQLEELFDSDRNEKCYKKSDLKHFIEDHWEWRITSPAQARTCYRKFQRIAGWLKIKNVIDDKEYSKAFWKGINRSLRNKLEVRHLCANPDHDLKNPFEVEKLVKIFSEVFGRDRFDIDDSDFKETDSSDSDSDKDTSDSDSSVMDVESKAIH
ncbi:hypothetical protein GY45DRAFT_1259218 [Cubamyces sp. BRFM 1775]|nr:hypothetical protein GY45DRAFT_1259218 [Cubamyces sp. BRFM 1775]